MDLLLERCVQLGARLARPGEFSERAFLNDKLDLAQAEAVLGALPFANLLYCRIDMARLPSGELAVMEAEAIEPYLYPEQGADLGPRVAEAIIRRLEEN